MTTVNMHEAKTRLSQLVAKVEAGEEVIISRDGKPVAKLTRIAAKKRAKFGFAKGTIKVIGDINDPMPDEWLDMFWTMRRFARTMIPMTGRLAGKRTPKPRKSRRRVS